ncbi:MAG: APC family permease [Alphaproteobacteria bacterium]|nr:APC family permease [Alphaproteobacteria bacterium]
MDNASPLKRRLSLPLLTLYGLGVTIGAGIYVLVGATAAEAGFYAPISFLIAAVVVGFTGFSYCEMATRYPVSAGEATYVREGLRSPTLCLAVGLLVAASGVVSSAAVSIGAANYLQTLVPLPTPLLTTMVAIVVGAVAVWGILQSVTVAAALTLVEIGGLIMAVVAGIAINPDAVAEIGRTLPPFEWEAWTGIAAATLLAFFAFVGFEDMANVAEEVKRPHWTMPRAIVLTLVVTTVLYILVVSVVVLVVPMEQLVGSSAPLALIFDQYDPAIRSAFGLIAIVATVNGVLIQMIMASRVLYGLGAMGSLPKIMAQVSPLTSTPVIATVTVTVLVLLFALLLPVAQLAETTSTIVLAVFTLVNASLIWIKRRGDAVPENVFTVPLWVPVVGCVTSVALLFSGFL